MAVFANLANLAVFLPIPEMDKNGLVFPFLKKNSIQWIQK
jgi:hypothetical protein